MKLEKRQSALLVLEDGSVYEGLSIGKPGTSFGELIFNTSATGYQEILTDPSYRGQIVLMTYPEIGNYGANMDDIESEKIHAAGFVVKRLSPTTSSWRAEVSLQEFLFCNGVVGIEGVDTRAITRRIRAAGAMKAGITTESISVEEFLQQVQAQPHLIEQNLVEQVTVPESYTLQQDDVVEEKHSLDKLVVMDYGIKRSILQSMLQFVREIVVLPAGTPFEVIASYQPDGVLLSNGPGDPTTLANEITMAKKLISSGIPTFGICLGHQILALASGAKVSKMPFGHHGGNHPVKDLETGQIIITSQNHGYAADFDDFPKDLVVTHVNLNDKTIEGFRHKKAPVSSVQFHPEASPGPHDTQYLFARFVVEALRQNQTDTLTA
jgi:carbamoyl-phosphate synthase small subunit